VQEADYVAGNPRWNGGDRLVVVSGCSGGGKSTLLAALAARGFQTWPEPGRQVVREELLVRGPALPWTDPMRFAERCLARAVYFYNCARPDDGPVLFDRSVVDAVTAMERLGGAPAHALEAVRRYRYARRVFMVPPWPELFAADPERRHDFAAAVAEYEALLASCAAKGYETVIVPCLGLEERVAFVEAALGNV
jgi:predicted ATPase